MDELGAHGMTHVLLGVRGRQLELPLEGVRAASRSRFDTALVDAARAAGVSVRLGFVAQLQGPANEQDFRTVDLMRVAKQAETGSFPLVSERPERVRARCVIAADGLGGALLAGVGETPQEVQPESRIGVGTRIDSSGHQQPSDRMRMSVGKGGYIGSVVLEDGRLDLAGAVDPQAMAHFGTAGLVERILEEAGVEPPPGLADANWSVTPALTRRAKGLNEHPLGSMRAFAIGDAAGYVEPFTGEGMAWALQSALTVQPLLRRAVEDWHESLGLEWARLHEEQFGGRRRACRRVAKLARSPRALSMAAMVLGHSRRARGLMARVGYGAGRVRRGSRTGPAEPDPSAQEGLIPLRRPAFGSWYRLRATGRTAWPRSHPPPGPLSTMVLVYHLLHVISAFLLTAYTFQAFANPDPARRKQTLMLTGILSLLMLTGGFGLVARLSYGWPGWVLVKVACWLGLSALAGIAFRKPEARGALTAIAIFLIALATYMVYDRPF